MTSKTSLVILLSLCVSASAFAFEGPVHQEAGRPAESSQGSRRGEITAPREGSTLQRSGVETDHSVGAGVFNNATGRARTGSTATAPAANAGLSTGREASTAPESTGGLAAPDAVNRRSAPVARSQRRATTTAPVATAAPVVAAPAASATAITAATSVESRIMTRIENKIGHARVVAIDAANSSVRPGLTYSIFGLVSTSGKRMDVGPSADNMTAYAMKFNGLLTGMNIRDCYEDFGADAQDRLARTLGARGVGLEIARSGSTEESVGTAVTAVLAEDLHIPLAEAQTRIDKLADGALCGTVNAKFKKNNASGSTASN